MGINHLLCDLGSPANIGSIIRTLHVLSGQTSQLYIFDPRDNLRRYAEDIEMVSTGLLSRRDFEVITDPEKFLGSYLGRKIATEIVESAIPLIGFNFSDGDLIIYGNENRGIPEIIRNLADHSVIVPMLGENYLLPKTDRAVAKNFGQYPNLNVSQTVAIVSYEASRQIGSFNGFKLK